jgi:hypothetical protein
MFLNIFKISKWASRLNENKSPLAPLYKSGEHFATAFNNYVRNATGAINDLTPQAHHSSPLRKRGARGDLGFAVTSQNVFISLKQP